MRLFLGILSSSYHMLKVYRGNNSASDRDYAYYFYLSMLIWQKYFSKVQLPFVQCRQMALSARLMLSIHLESWTVGFQLGAWFLCILSHGDRVTESRPWETIDKATSFKRTRWQRRTVKFSCVFYASCIGVREPRSLCKRTSKSRVGSGRSILGANTKRASVPRATPSDVIEGVRLQPFQSWL